MSFTPIVHGVLFGCALVLAGCTASMPAGPAYEVFFTPTSADIDASAQAVITSAAKAARADTGQTVTVAGYANSSPYGAPAGEFLISRSRSQAVANALVSRGVAQSRIVQLPRGPAAGDPGLESRRVEIVLGR